MLFLVVYTLCLAQLASGFVGSSARFRRADMVMSAKGGKGGANFNYDPSNYKDSNDANYRRLTDQLAAVKAEDEKLKRERDEIIRKEQMALMFLKKENETFWNTPNDLKVATSDKFFVNPEVLQIIDDLDNQLIGLQPVKEKMRRYANQMLIHKIRG